MQYPVPVKIAGVGSYLPERVVHSRDLSSRCGVPDGWIEKKQGVLERRWADGESASYMGAEAVKEAVNDAGIALNSIDLILNASGSAEQAIPDNAPLIQRHLELSTSGVACITVHTTCLSFLSAFDLSTSLLASGRYRTIAIVSTEVASSALNFNHAESSTLFGDAAAAAILTRTPPGASSCVHTARYETYGDGAYLTQIPGGGSRKHPNDQTTLPVDNLFHMEGRKVFRMATRYIPGFLNRLDSRWPETLGEDVDAIVAHQPSKLAMDYFVSVGMPSEKLFRTLSHYGNCVSASIPLTLYLAINEKQIKRGDKVLMFGTGAGFSLGGIIITY